MKRLILYFLFLLVFLATGTLLFGFYNAREMRNWVRGTNEVISKFSLSGGEKESGKRLQEIQGRNAKDLAEKYAGFNEALSEIEKKSSLAVSEIEKASCPRALSGMKEKIFSHFEERKRVAGDLSKNIRFTNELLFQTAAVFDRIEADASLDEIKGVIGDARSAGSQADPSLLPEETRAGGTELKSSFDRMLGAMERSISENVSEGDEMQSMYAEFSKNVDNFLASTRTFSQKMKEFERQEKEISAELLTIESIRFSLK